VFSGVDSAFYRVEYFKTLFSISGVNRDFHAREAQAIPRTMVKYEQTKERIVREVGYGLSLEGASAADLVKSMRAQNEPVAQRGKVT
jgi:hypothetical protein